MRKIRVYALILGKTLPKAETTIGSCVIKPMSIAEQKARRYSPIKEIPIKKSKLPYGSCVATCDLDMDQRVIKSKYVMYVDVDVGAPEAAISIAYSLFEQAVAALSIATISEHKVGNRTFTDFSTYEYQLVKVYALEGDKEVPVKLNLHSGEGHHKIEFPRNTFEDIEISATTVNDLLQLIENNTVVKAAIEYLNYATRCQVLRLPSELIVLNLCKSVETLLYNLTYKRSVKGFNKKLDDANTLFRLDADERRQIKKMWKMRGNDDVAHATERYLFAQYYINEVPTSKNKLIGIVNEPDIVAKMIWNYVKFIDSLVHVKVQKYQRKEHRHTGLVYTTNRGYFTYDSNQTKSVKLTNSRKVGITV